MMVFRSCVLGVHLVCRVMDEDLLATERCRKNEFAVVLVLQFSVLRSSVTAAPEAVRLSTLDFSRASLCYCSMHTLIAKVPMSCSSESFFSPLLQLAALLWLLGIALYCSNDECFDFLIGIITAQVYHYGKSVLVLHLFVHKQVIMIVTLGDYYHQEI